MLATTILASSLAFVDGSVVSVGLQAIGASFKASPADLQWAINAYLLPLSALLLELRIGPGAVYWIEVFPAILVIAIGMAGAVAPLTAAVLASVDKQHTGSASGFNSAAARTGGMVATALLGGVLGASGSTLIAGFHTSAVICANVSVGASASAFFLIHLDKAATGKAATGKTG